MDWDASTISKSQCQDTYFAEVTPRSELGREGIKGDVQRNQRNSNFIISNSNPTYLSIHTLPPHNTHHEVALFSCCHCTSCTSFRCSIVPPNQRGLGTSFRTSNLSRKELQEICRTLRSRMCRRRASSARMQHCVS